MTSHALFYHEIYKLSDLAKLYRIADRVSHPRWKDRSKDQEFYLKTKKLLEHAPCQDLMETHSFKTYIKNVGAKPYVNKNTKLFLPKNGEVCYWAKYIQFIREITETYFVYAQSPHYLVVSCLSEEFDFGDLDIRDLLLGAPIYPGYNGLFNVVFHAEATVFVHEMETYVRELFKIYYRLVPELDIKTKYWEGGLKKVISEETFRKVNNEALNDEITTRSNTPNQFGMVYLQSWVIKMGSLNMS